jgi:metal iron transporter
MIGSLLSFAVVINSLCVRSLDVRSVIGVDIFNRILMLASSVFFYTHPTTDKQPASLFDAYDLIRDLVGLRMFLRYMARRLTYVDLSCC